MLSKFLAGDPSSSPTTVLVERCLRNDPRAWEALLQRYARLVHSVAARHGLTPDEVDDVGQEVFLALAQNLHAIDDPERLPAWLATTARRLSWRVLQRRARRNTPGTRHRRRRRDTDRAGARQPAAHPR